MQSIQNNFFDTWIIFKSRTITRSFSTLHFSRRLNSCVRIHLLFSFSITTFSFELCMRSCKVFFQLSFSLSMSFRFHLWTWLLFFYFSFRKVFWYNWIWQKSRLLKCIRTKSHTTNECKSWSIFYWSNQNRIRWISFDHWKENTQFNESISSERFMYTHQLCWLTSKVSSCMWQFFRSRKRLSIFSKRIQTKHYIVLWVLLKVHFEKKNVLEWISTRV